MSNDRKLNAGEILKMAVPEQFARIGEDGWISGDDPPDTDRLVQIAWDDGSTSTETLGFWDGISEIPDSGRRFWWQYHFKRGMQKLPDKTVYAWRERR